MDSQTIGNRKLDSDDTEMYIHSKRPKSNDSSLDETSSEDSIIDDRLQRMTSAFKTIIEVKKHSI